MPNGATLIAAERTRQVTEEGWSPSGDRAEHTNGELWKAAKCYLGPRPDRTYPPYGWPWSMTWWEPKGRIRNLVRAGALIAAEIDRLQGSVHDEEESNDG